MAEAGLKLSVRQSAPVPLDAVTYCAPGELLAMVGPSGSGKSTLLRCIAGLVRPAVGKIEAGGELWYDAAAGVHLQPHRRRVGMVFQQYALFPHLDAESNVMAAMLDLPIRQRRSRAREWLARVHLAGLERRRPHELSGGQQQRVALARALARSPRALLLDEPFSAVDRATRERLYQELAELRRDLSMPIVLVTHDLEEAALLADRMVLVARGRTLQSGTPDEVMHRPATVEVARLVGIRNIFRGQVVAHRPADDRTIVRWDGRELRARHQPHVATGSPVHWCVSRSHVLVHAHDRPSSGVRENPLAGKLASMVTLGERVLAVVHVDADPARALGTSIPRHKARRLGLAEGSPMQISLVPDGIHLLAAADTARTGVPAGAT